MVSSQATVASPPKSPGHPIPVSVNISLFFVRSLISPSQGSRSQAVLNESTLKLESRKSSAPGATACSLRILLTSLHFTNSQGGSADLALLNQKGQLECPRYQKRRQDIKLRSPASVGFPIATHPIQRWRWGYNEWSRIWDHQWHPVNLGKRSPAQGKCVVLCPLVHTSLFQGPNCVFEFVLG